MTTTAPAPLAPELVIDGEAVAAGDGTYPVCNPARPGEVVLEAPAASLAQVDLAVAAARRAQPGWAALEFGERAALVATASAAVQRAVDDEELAPLLVREHGKVLWEAAFDTGTLGGMATAFAGLARQALAPRVIAEGTPSTTVVPSPLGVVAALLPFNWPVAVLGNKLIPALLTGNTVVVKPPPSCPGAVLRATAAMATSLPAGVVNVVNGPAPSLGAALVGHAGVDMVSFTGGPATGRAVMGGAASSVRPLVLELGGNDPAIIAPDVTIDEALADRLISGAFVTSGQVCMAIKRLYVSEASLPALIDALVDRVGKEVVGDGLREDVTMGPVHQASARDRVEGMVAEAERGGARVHRPAALVGDHSDGYFVSPAIVESPDPASSIVVDEQFAPALPVLAYRDLDEAVARANDTPYGLCASIWTGDDGLAREVSSRLEAGTVFVNIHGMAAMDHRAPFGGWKQSGYGLELGVEGMAAFTHPKTVLAHPPVAATGATPGNT